MAATYPSVRTDRPGYRPFVGIVHSIKRMCPSFLRITLHSPDFIVFGTDGVDQRVKLILPLPDGTFAEFGAQDPATIDAGTWYQRWKEVPEERRNVIRTYTVRSIDPVARLLDIDFVVHDHPGPAGMWALNARPGDSVIVVGPDARSIHSATGIDFHPGSAQHVLLVGDETAVPAMNAIIESKPNVSSIHAIVEVPDGVDYVAMPARANVSVSWASRNPGELIYGHTLLPRVREWTHAHSDILASQRLPKPQPLADVDVDRELLWDSPATEATAQFYAWMAGEAGAIKELRRFLVRECRIDRAQVAFMGYWRAGRAESQ